jgi:hypothetical protein
MWPPRSLGRRQSRNFAIEAPIATIANARVPAIRDTSGAIFGDRCSAFEIVG